MRHPRILVPIMIAAAIALGSASPASAKLQVGISEQKWEMFTDPFFKPLKIKYGRIVVPWNILTRKDYWPAYLKAWLDGAKAMRVEPHVAFNIIDIKPRYFGKGPTLGQYTKLIKGFRKKYKAVRVFTPWNEANHSFQPTARKPKLAASYYKILKKTCRTCKVLKADVLDDANMSSWLKKYKRYSPGRGIWGIHNYQDANKGRSLRTSQTLKITKLVKGDIWSTEAGGLVGFQTTKGRVAYKYSLARQIKAQRYLFKLMRSAQVRKRYKRVYIYNYFGTWTKAGKRLNRWDSGLLSVSRKPRPAYHDLKKQIRRG